MEEFYSEYINHCAMQNCSLPAQTCVSEKGIVEPFLGVRWVWQGRKPHGLRGFLHMQTWHQLPTSCHRHKAGAAEMWVWVVNLSRVSESPAFYPEPV